MHRYPPRRRILSRFAAVSLVFSALGACATVTPAALDEAANRSSADSLEQLLGETSVSEATTNASNLERAWRLVEARDCEQAMPLAVSVLRNDHEDMDARLVVAECAVIDDDTQSAEQHYEQILAETREPRALRGLGVIRAREGRYDEAQVLLEEAVSVGPNDWRTWNALGFISDVEGDWVNAADAYQRAAGLAPGEAPPLNNLGLSYLQQGQTEAAIGAFTEAMIREPDFDPAGENLRMALIFDGQLENALWGLPEERRPVVLNNAGIVARSQGDMELAATLFQRALDESPVFYERAFNNLRALNLNAASEPEPAAVD